MEKLTLDIDLVDGSSRDAAASIDASFKKIDLPTKKIILWGSGTDSGGGGVRESLKVELLKMDRIIGNGNTYLIATCSIHCIQLCLSHSIRQCYGDGGLGRQTLLQILHTAYNLQLIKWRFLH